MPYLRFSANPLFIFFHLSLSLPLSLVLERHFHPRITYLRYTAHVWRCLSRNGRVSVVGIYADRVSFFSSLSEPRPNGTGADDGSIVFSLFLARVLGSTMMVSVVLALSCYCVLRRWRGKYRRTPWPLVTVAPFVIIYFSHRCPTYCARTHTLLMYHTALSTRGQCTG